MAKRNIVVEGFWPRAYVVGVLISVIAFVIMFFLNIVISAIAALFSLTMQGTALNAILAILVVFILAPLVLGGVAIWVNERVRK